MEKVDHTSLYSLFVNTYLIMVTIDVFIYFHRTG